MPNETGVLAWIMSRQRMNEEVQKSIGQNSNISKVKSESDKTLVGSKTQKSITSRLSSRVSDRLNASAVSSSSKTDKQKLDSAHQQWKTNVNSSNSNLSGLSKKQ